MAKLTKKDFQRIADACFDARRFGGALHREENHGQPANVCMERVEEGLADYLATTNGLFQRSKFLRACREGKA